jgi:pyrrolidone-carboxylate peptidase
MLTGYWPPTNEMVRHFSTNPEQNPDGWAGENWESRGYDVYSYFPEFPDGLGQGVGDFEVDYQDTSADFWRVVDDLHPVAIMTFGRSGPGRSWEIECRARNLNHWYNDYEAPFQPTPAPPDPNVPAGYVRYSTLPTREIMYAVNAAYDELEINAFVDETGYCGRFLCEYIAYHAAWYHDLHADPNDPYWNVSAGHIHVTSGINAEDGRIATEITLRELITYVDAQVPEPSAAALLLAGVLLVRIVRRPGPFAG